MNSLNQKPKLSKADFKALMKKGHHKFVYCTHCRYPMIVCGYCGNNTCNGGVGETCKDSCEEAYKLFYAHQYPWWMTLRARVGRRVYKAFRKIQVRWLDWKYEREQK